MKNNDVKIISAQKIDINNNELSARLGVDRNFKSETVEKCREILNKTIIYKCAYIRTKIDLTKENICDFGFMKIPSKNLYKNLYSCSEAFVMALTSGIALDRLLAKLNVSSQAEHFITDALGSAAIESFCDYASNEMKQNLNCAPRFSPGYGDVSLEFQKPLLERLNASELLGITLNSSYLMTPVKSITAVMGIKNEKNN